MAKTAVVAIVGPEMESQAIRSWPSPVSWNRPSGPVFVEVVAFRFK